MFMKTGKCMKLNLSTILIKNIFLAPNEKIFHISIIVIIEEYRITPQNDLKMAQKLA